jgi:hypothetical protein
VAAAEVEAAEAAEDEEEDGRDARLFVVFEASEEAAMAFVSDARLLEGSGEGDAAADAATDAVSASSTSTSVIIFLHISPPLWFLILSASSYNNPISIPETVSG